MNKRVFLLALFIVALIAAGCRESNETLSADNVNIDVQASELSGGMQVLIVEILNDDGEELPVESLSVRGDMNHAGMVPVIVEYDSPEALEDFKSTEPGVWLIPFGWTMGGEWILTVDAGFPETDGQEAVEASTQFTLNITENMVVEPMDMDGMEMESTPEATPESESDGSDE